MTVSRNAPDTANAANAANPTSAASYDCGYFDGCYLPEAHLIKWGWVFFFGYRPFARPFAYGYGQVRLAAWRQDFSPESSARMAEPANGMGCAYSLAARKRPEVSAVMEGVEGFAILSRQDRHGVFQTLDTSNIRNALHTLDALDSFGARVGAHVSRSYESLDGVYLAEWAGLLALLTAYRATGATGPLLVRGDRDDLLKPLDTALSCHTSASVNAVLRDMERRRLGAPVSPRVVPVLTTKAQRRAPLRQRMETLAADLLLRIPGGAVVERIPRR